MNVLVSNILPDVQATADLRNLVIQRAGVKAVTHPVTVSLRSGPQPSIAVVDMDVALAAAFKGVHMSRFIEVLTGFQSPLDAATVAQLAEAMVRRLGADAGRVELRLPIFIRKAAPVSGVESLLDHRIVYRAELGPEGTQVTLEVETPVTSLCPCSKEISLYGAHNQRSHITISATLSPGADLLPDDLVDLAEGHASCELWGLLKRPDEKYVTERAYENPKFVEDLVRDIALDLQNDPRILRYAVASENFESIHNHSAYARLEGPQ